MPAYAVNLFLSRTKSSCSNLLAFVLSWFDLMQLSIGNATGSLDDRLILFFSFSSFTLRVIFSFCDNAETPLGLLFVWLSLALFMTNLLTRQAHLNFKKSRNTTGFKGEYIFLRIIIKSLKVNEGVDGNLFRHNSQRWQNFVSQINQAISEVLESATTSKSPRQIASECLDNNQSKIFVALISGVALNCK